MDKAYLKNFKAGVAAALLKGNMAAEYSDGYKQGYDFGLTMYQRLYEENGDE